MSRGTNYFYDVAVSSCEPSYYTVLYATEFIALFTFHRILYLEGHLSGPSYFVQYWCL